MRKIIVSMWTTLDGYVAGPNDEMDWLALDEEVQGYETSLVQRAEALLLGRTTHGDFAGAWPGIARDESQEASIRAYAQRVDSMPKFVVSESGHIADWTNTTRLATFDKDAVTQFKRDGAGDVVVYGSLRVIATLQAMNMIDEYHLLVHPTAIGNGKPLFSADQSPVQLRLRDAEPLPTGVVLTRYEALP